MNNQLHIAIIMDGNGRWATAQNKSRSEGHEAGTKNIKQIAFACANSSDVAVLSLFAFSTENWNRSDEEINFLFDLPYRKLNPVIDDFIKEGIRIKFIHLKEKLKPKLLNYFKEVEEKTKVNTKLLLNIFINYGGRQDILNAVKQTPSTLSDFDKSLMGYDEMTKENFNVDILIRTGKEKRISNFLLWQLAYAELFFTETMWPEFSQEELLQIIKEFKLRDRRFGGVKSK